MGSVVSGTMTPILIRFPVQDQTGARKSGLSARGRPCAKQLTLPASAHYIRCLPMSVSKIQIGQLWKKDGTGDTYLVTRLYTEALSTMVILRKSGAEEEALTRVRAERTPKGQNIPGFSPAQEDESG